MASINMNGAGVPGPLSFGATLSELDSSLGLAAGALAAPDPAPLDVMATLDAMRAARMDRDVDDLVQYMKRMCGGLELDRHLATVANLRLAARVAAQTIRMGM